MNPFDLLASEWHWYVWEVIVGITCTVPCALLGCYLVLQRMSLLGDAISHGLLPGIVLGALVSGQITGWPIILGAMAFGLLTAFLTQSVHQLAGVPEDASMGVVFTSLFALGVVLISQPIFRNVDLDTNCVLYGLIEGIPIRNFVVAGWPVPVAFPTMFVVLLATIAFVLLLWKELKISAFDPGLATALGLNATVLHYLLMLMVAGVTVTAFEAVGSVLVIAMLIVPAAAAHLLTDRLSTMMVLSAAIAVLTTLGGVILAGPRLLNTNVAGMMAVVVGVLFTLAVLFAPRHGVLARALGKVRLGIRIRAEDILAGLFRREEPTSFRDESARQRLDAELAKAQRGVAGALAMLRLRQQMQVDWRDGWQLTAAGRQLASEIVRAHRLWEAYLGENFALPLDHLHGPAERMEHFLGPAIRQRLAAELRSPAVDPHGKTIPPGPQTEN